MRSARKPAIGSAMLLLCILAIPGRGAAADPPVTGPATTSAFTPTACPVQLPDATEGEGYVCGFVSVPMHHADPGGPQVQLATVRILSTTEPRRSRPVVIAPDVPVLDLVSAAPESLADLAGLDLILFDRRGTGLSVPLLHCDEHDPVALATLTGQAATADALDADVQAYAACATRFAATGVDMAAFGTRESAADVRDVVTALGYTDYDFMGISGATRTGQALLRDVPDGLHSVVLDSVAPASVNISPLRAQTTYAAMQDLFGACSEDETCAASFPDPAGMLFETAARLTAEPAHVPVADGDTTLDVVVTGRDLLQVVADRFRGGAAEIDGIPAFISQAAGGDLSAVAGALAQAALDTTAADGAAYARRCSEDLPGATDYALDGVPEALWFLAGGDGERNVLVDICAALGITDQAGTLHDPVTSDIPVLTLTGEFDALTPATGADLVRSTLTTSYGLEFPGVGQGTLLAASCPRTVAARFVAAPGQEPDASCIAEMPEFTTAVAQPSPGPSVTPEATPRPDRTPRPVKTPKPAKAPKARPVKVGLEQVADGFENANGINNAGDKRLFISEQEGYVEVLKPNKDGTFRDAGKFLDIRSRVICCGEKGFLGIAFPPDYAQTGYFYVTFAGTGHTWNLEERRVSATNPDRADPNYKRRLIRVYKPLDYHWAGDMHFGADGYLYVTVGDGGFGGTTKDPGDPENRAQDLGVMFGKMLRIDPRGSRRDGDRYSVPRSNPFVRTKGALPEIWAYGLRNPWRWSFDSLTNDLWIGDVGMWSYEEVNRAQGPNAGKGANFGWRRMEGPVCYNPTRRCDTGKLTLPYSWYAHQDGMCAVAGGYVYRGTRYPALRSWYVFGDYCTGRILLLDSAGKPGKKPRVALDTKANFSALGEGADGEIYVVDYGPGNTLYRVTGAPR
jgi:glucose/arabinose dehydrogenase/pimeloyl-ACP methyl ester carboxylesterase